MGIKGKKRKLKEREKRLQEQMEAGELPEEVMRNTSGVMVMGDGPFQPSVDVFGNVKMKKSELYKLNDQEYLESIKEEHQNRRQSHLQTSLKRLREEEEEHLKEIQEVEEKVLGRKFTSEDAWDTILNSPDPTTTDKTSRKKSSKVGKHGALFSHPLMGIHPSLIHALHLEGFERMTKIQERTIPYALQAYDLLGQARTGSGKTLAFCIPILQQTRETCLRYPNALLALLLAPTKELCVQTFDVLTAIVKHIPEPTFKVQLITGGTKVLEERRQLLAGTNIVVGTPGRIHDHVLHCKGWDLSRLRFLVLDEADRMLADGFQRDLDAILGPLPKSRQTFLFSATNSKSVQELARLSLSRTPIFIGTTGDAPLPLQQVDGQSDGALPAVIPPYQVYTDPQQERGEEVAEEHNDTDAPDDEAEALPSTLTQFCHICPYEDRLLSLYVFVKRVARTSKAMVFCSTIASTIFHCQIMASVGFHHNVMMLHGHMKHRQRVQAFRIFQEWENGVLFCTDVAARGLDIPQVHWILQLDPPLDPTEYIHRVGRTARAGNVGNSLLFLAPEEAVFARYLNKFNIKLEKLPMPDKLPPIREKLEHVLQIDEVVAKSAIAAYRAHVGAYQSHILKDIFDAQKIDLEGLAAGFALSAAPQLSLPKNNADEKKKEYVKGKLKSLNKRKQSAIKYYQEQKTKRQWDEGGSFIGVHKPRPS
ncbi:DEAD/DEAH box helicase/Helicase conserved C-terminal domain/Domain of unknown function (DUF4217), putative [Angomonas deanei]|uniref:ATP-dependent RNA helicase n=1 Tax=Angomonas deanei TaxID=59799 RepID=A0A7G2CAU0_9TRYP|nr:DEAD/DEAH box helicase/Helicase conserved C-terminal domain/Domain of unknown function (DUF4217), putative [Angomonas deanei]